ncbi:hypothetical protein RHMOL_Rhmol13G0153900 [Rhododendron molle]|uniref:Uncharacterized protein n=1 Tax=Rhododendron molle TaxID=49168 RepID=A0ACC0L728_RHOML|nr:hypothetical protein RHMOL_Rhmol13G0153900 [Rhododendron molle]
MSPVGEMYGIVRWAKQLWGRVLEDALACSGGLFAEGSHQAAQQPVTAGSRRLVMEGWGEAVPPAPYQKTLLDVYREKAEKKFPFDLKKKKAEKRKVRERMDRIQSLLG